MYDLLKALGIATPKSMSTDEVNTAFSDEEYRLPSPESGVETIPYETGGVIKQLPFEPAKERTTEGVDVEASVLGGVPTEVGPAPINVEEGVLGGKWTDPISPTREEVISAVDVSLLEKEGASGDTTGAAVTGERGLTEAQRKRIMKDPNITTEAEAIKVYLGEAYDKLSTLDGWSSASTELQEELLDLGYNMDYTKVAKFKGLGGSLAKLESGEASEEEVIYNILDTANTGGKTSKGLAKRRADSFNRVADTQIVKIEQKPDGEIIYYDVDGNVVKSYGKGKGLAKGSVVGILTQTGEGQWS